MSIFVHLFMGVLLSLFQVMCGVVMTVLMAAEISAGNSLKMSTLVNKAIILVTWLCIGLTIWGIWR